MKNTLADIYFVANRQLSERKMKAIFRLSGKKPEFWDPVTGNISTANNWRMTENGRTEIELEMTPAGSVFVIFREPTELKTYNNPTPEPRVSATLDGDWTVTFDPAHGPAEPVPFKHLDEWNNNSNPLIKYYSGTARYKKSFYVEDTVQQIYLDLGNVEFMSRVKINGNDLGLLWKPPYEVEITNALKKGDNEIEIEVTNSWANRLIGDEKLQELDLSKVPSWLSEGKPIPSSWKRKTYITHKYYDASDPLVPSGLLGPVQLKR